MVPGTVQNGIVHGIVQYRMVSVQNGTVQNGTVQNDTIQNGANTTLAMLSSIKSMPPFSEATF